MSLESGSGVAEGQIVGDFATSLASLLKATTIYPRVHPRVRAAGTDFLALLPHVGSSSRWLPVRVRGRELGVGNRWLQVDTPLLQWLADRLRDGGLCGIEFGPACEVDDLLDFAEAIGRHKSRSGEAFAWPADHARLRPLDLVFHGEHREDTANGDDVVAPSEAEVRRQELIRSLEDRDAIVQRMLSIEAGCRQASDHAVGEEVDLLAAIVDLLPVEIATDPDLVAEIVLEVLDRVHASLVDVLRKKERIDDAELTRLALAVARRYFESRGPSQRLRRDLPTGRPEDEQFGPDLNALLMEMAALPECSGRVLPPAHEFARSNPAMATELLGVQLHLLVGTRRSESLAKLRQSLASLSKGLDPMQAALMDAYLRPNGADGAAPVGDAAALAMLGFFDRIGMALTIRQRGYLTPGLLARTFPVSLPLAARVLGDDPGGIAALREGLQQVEPARRATGMQVAVQQGLLLEEAVVRALIAVGNELVLPMLEPAAGSDDPALKELVVAFLRTLALPEAEAAVLRCYEPAASLPGHYLQELLRLGANRKAPEPRLRAFSGQLLRAFVDRGIETLPVDRLLGAIDCLRHVPGNESAVFLRRLASTRRFRLGARSRAIRSRAKAVLAVLQGGRP